MAMATEVDLMDTDTNTVTEPLTPLGTTTTVTAKDVEAVAEKCMNCHCSRSGGQQWHNYYCKLKGDGVGQSLTIEQGLKLVFSEHHVACSSLPPLPLEVPKYRSSLGVCNKCYLVLGQYVHSVHVCGLKKQAFMALSQPQSSLSVWKQEICTNSSSSNSTSSSSTGKKKYFTSSATQTKFNTATPDKEINVHMRKALESGRSRHYFQRTLCSITNDEMRRLTKTKVFSDTGGGAAATTPPGLGPPPQIPVITGRTPSAGAAGRADESQSSAEADFDKLVSTLKTRLPTEAPTIYAFLNGFCDVGKNWSITPAMASMLGVGAMARSVQCNRLQRIVGLELWRIKAPQKTINKFNKLGLCPSIVTITRFVDSMATSYDDPVLAWKKEMEQVLSQQQQQPPDPPAPHNT